MNIQLASRLSEIRKENKLSQEALAEKMGLSRQAISKWERGERAPDTSNLIALSKIYGVSLDTLLSNTDFSSETHEDEIKIINENTQLSEKPLTYKEKIALNKAKPILFPQLNSLMKKLPVFLIVPVLYVSIGLGLNIWHPTWFMFFLIPMHLQLLHASYAKTRKSFFRRLPVFFVALVAFLTVGFTLSLWEIGVVFLITVPLYYCAVSILVKE